MYVSAPNWNLFFSVKHIKFRTEKEYLCKKLLHYSFKKYCEIQNLCWRLKTTIFYLKLQRLVKVVQK